MVKINMKMPESCGKCPFMDNEHGDYPWCVALQQNRGYNFDIFSKKFPNCPLREDDISEKEKLIETQKDMLRVMFNRCHAVGSANGAMCRFCGLKDKCTELSTVG